MCGQTPAAENAMQTQTRSPAAARQPSLILGVGASAGGIPAFQRLLEGVSPDVDAAIVLVMHLSPDRVSGLAEALGPSTELPVIEAADGMPLERGHVYVIPANATLTVEDGRLRIRSPRVDGARRQTIDTFLSSLAAAAGERAVGIVLSGTGADGAAGLVAIKDAGGATLAQDQTAEFSDMPEAAAATGVVDRILPPEQMMQAAEDLARAEEQDVPPLGPVLERLEQASGLDFGRYKPAMLHRRVRRRMAMAGKDSLGGYVSLLDEDPQELQRLLQDVLINVTAFFRDPDSYEALREHAMPAMLEGQGPLRVWVPGCASGEEAYSLTIAFIEHMEQQGVQRKLQVFATDVDEQALATARLGIYPASAMQDLGQERTRRFFTQRQDGGFEVARALRDACIFARHDLTGDPPFSRLDLISCRNVLIYFHQDVQRRIIPVFHYALREGGFLMLGPAETVNDQKMFKEVERGSHLYRRRRGPPVRPPEGYPFNPPRSQAAAQTHPTPPLATLQEEVDRLRLDLHAPPGIVVDEDGQILLICGDPVPYVAPGPGRPEASVEKLVHDDLQAELEGALVEARTEHMHVRREGVHFETKDGLRAVDLDITPLPGPHGTVHLVIFETPAAPPEAPQPNGASPREVERLRSTLFTQRLHHHAVMRRLEAANEELRTTHEEYLATNEEYQSTNEELETAKEELQSSYEELTTVNDQLRAHSQEVERLFSDLENIVASLRVPLMIIGPDLAIRRMQDPHGLISAAAPSDLGRPLDDLHIHLPVDLPALAKQAMHTGDVQEEELQDRRGRWQQLRVWPYRTKDGERAGAVIVLLDVDVQKTEALAHQRARALADAIIDTSPVPLLLLDDDLVIVRANDAFGRTFDDEPAALKGQPLFDIAHRRWDLPVLRRLLKGALERHEDFGTVEVEAELHGLGPRVLLISGRTIPATSKRPEMVLLTIVDETEHRASDRELERLRQAEMDRLVHLNQFKAEFIGMAAHELSNPLTPLPIQVRVLEEADLEPRQQQALAAIQRSAAAMHRIVKDMLLAAKFQSGRIDLEKREVDLEPIVAAVCNNYERPAQEQDLGLEVSLQPVKVSADLHFMEGVVRNLLSNALKYTPAGGSIHVTLRPEGLGAVLQVRDTGIGLSEWGLDHIFQPFTRLHKNEVSVGGTGLGLYISKGIVEMHGGTLDVTSPGPGKGSTFTMRLPA